MLSDLLGTMRPNVLKEAGKKSSSGTHATKGGGGLPGGFHRAVPCFGSAAMGWPHGIKAMGACWVTRTACASHKGLDCAKVAADYQR